MIIFYHFTEKNRHPFYFARMKEKRQRITKRRSKQVIAAAKINAKLEILSKPKPIIPVWKSCWIISSAAIATINKNVYEEKKMLSACLIQKQYIDIPYGFTCTDLSDSIWNWLKLFSCYCCDNYSLDKSKSEEVRMLAKI